MSPYGKQKGKHEIKDQSHLLPLSFTLKDGQTIIEIGRINNDDLKVKSQVHKLLNSVLEEGKTYPQYGPLDNDEFESYYLSHDSYSATLTTSDGIKTVVGAVYIKPNFPGRASHICNGGFLVHEEYRGRGVGGALADAFERLAVDLGYKAAFFNLVFVTNEASVRLWKSRGYQEIGVIPSAADLKDIGYTDAIQFYKQFMNK